MFYCFCMFSVFTIWTLSAPRKHLERRIELNITGIRSKTNKSNNSRHRQRFWENGGPRHFTAQPVAATTSPKAGPWGRHGRRVHFWSKQMKVSSNKQWWTNAQKIGNSFFFAVLEGWDFLVDFDWLWERTLENLERHTGTFGTWAVEEIREEVRSWHVQPRWIEAGVWDVAFNSGV